MANELKHTPGPWAVNEETAFVRTADDDQYAVAIAYGENGNAGGGEVAIANARLIAAAPELLEALQAVVAVADRATIEFDKARAAIAKATGAA